MAVAPSRRIATVEAAEVEQSIATRFEEQVALHAERLAVCDDHRSLTYDELNRLANRIGHNLPAGQAGRVVVCIESGAQCLAAIVGVLKAGHAYVPVDPAFPEARNAYIVQDVQASVILTNSRNLAMAQGLAQSAAQGSTQGRTQGATRVVNVDALPAESPERNLGREISPDALAYIIYTSGSTGKPKGVMQNHRGLLHGWMRRTRLQHVTPADRMTLFYSCSVMGAVYCIFGSLLNGASLFPYDFREKGVDGLAAWLQAHKITIYHSVASVFRQFATQYGGPSSGFSVRLVVFGGERVLVSDVELARAVFSRNVEFYTGLGSTETGTVRYFYVGPETVLKDATVPIGYPVEGMEVVLIDDDGKPVGPGQVGEITIRSRYLAVGYWNNPEATAKVFGTVPSEPDVRVYHTGDMGELRADGLLQHRGRKDFQVKIRGFRVEVGEVETALLEHAGIKEAVVVAREVGAESQLVAYLVASDEESKISVRTLRQRLQKRVPYYMVPTVYVRLDAIPRTPNNKVDRLKLPEPSADNSLLDDVRVAPVDEVEQGLLDICGDLLRASEIGTNHNFFDLGGHSLSATQLVARVQQRFGVKLGMREVFEAPDFKAIATLIRTHGPGRAAAERVGLTPAPREGRLPVSFAQRRMWLVDCLNRSNSAYNISNTVRIDGPLDVAALGRALSEMVARHEVLRTRFPSDDDGPWQDVVLPAPVTLLPIDLRDRSPEERDAQSRTLVREMLQRHHDLARGPLFQCALIRLEAQSAILILVFNHIIYDNIWSSGIFFRELGALYEAFSHGATASPLSPLPFQFVDYAVWERSRTAQGDLQPHLEYWKKQLANLPPPLQVPGDHVRPDAPSLRGGQIAFHVPAALAAAMTDLARAETATPFMALLACWQLLLHRYTQQNDIVVGTPTGRRYLAETEGMIGLFINNLVLRTDFSSKPTFRKLLAQVRQTTIDGFTHDELPFEDLVAALRPERSTGVSPFFQHMFIHRNATHSRWALPGLSLTPLPIHVGGSKFDLTLSMLEEGAQLSGTLEYSSDLFERDSAERIAAHFVALLGSAVESPDRPVSQLDLLAPEERRALRHEWNPPATSYPALRPHELFEQRVMEQPDALAVVGQEYSLTYAELNWRANKLAARLRDLGVGPDQLVAVCLERSPQLVVALLAVLKAGGAYVPLDPGFPAERLRYMVENAQAKVCISQREVLDRLPEVGAEVILLDSGNAGATGGPGDNLEVRGTADDLAYVIYTSGSTGRPKGVQITQRALVNFLVSMQKEPGIGRGDVLHSLTTICFDIAGLELFLPLISGARVVIKPQKLALDPRALLASLAETGATLMQATPITWRMLLDHGWRGFPKIKVLCGGEAMSPELAEQLVATGCEVWNMYGPTETTIWSSVRRVASRADAVNLGYPIANTEFLILGPELALQPIGVPGELLIGGDGLARGYFRLDEVTREKFIPHPFEAGRRLYRTGDLAVRRAGGQIQFLGRIDNQVKIRGFRIELGEIEAQLEEHPWVKQAVVVAREDTPGDKRLVAYLLPRPGCSVDTGAMREFARSRMPEYMVPSAFVALSEYPQTPNGKVDRARLPAPAELAPPPAVEPHPSGSVDIADQVREILEGSLKARLTSVSDNFFDLGGHSMAAITAVRAINQRFGIDLPPTALFDMPTAEKLAVAISHARAGLRPDELHAQRLNPDQTLRVDLILEEVREAAKKRSADRSASSSAAPDTAPGSFPGMQESFFCRYVLGPLYVRTGRSLREPIKRAILKLEGGSAFTVTLRRLFKQCHDIEIGDFTSCSFDAARLRSTTKIGKFCSIYRTSLFQNADHPRNTLATHGLFYHRRFGFSSGYELERVQIEVGNDVWIGDGAKILDPTRKIGDGAIIAAGAVVIEDVPPYAIVAGYPAQVVRYRFSQETIAKLLALRWWDRPIEELHLARDAFMKALEGDRIR